MEKLRNAVCAVVFRKGAILLIRKGEHWILPGGKPEAGESNLQALVREFSEELPAIHITRVSKYLGEFEGQTPHTKDRLKATVFKAEVEGRITPSAEISEARWVPLATINSYDLSDITRLIVDALFHGASIS